MRIMNDFFFITLGIFKLSIMNMYIFRIRKILCIYTSLYRCVCIYKNVYVRACTFASLCARVCVYIKQNDSSFGWAPRKNTW